MIVGIIALSILLLAALVALFFTAKRALELHTQLTELRDQIEVALDELNVVYGHVMKKSKLEIMLDEPVVRDLMEDIKHAANVILVAANRLKAPFTLEINDVMTKNENTQ